ncbi:hypothetical protein ACHAW5_010020 [Stephanodiscus triporus]|uniref:Uncharacterized protein n=1 Tax=Stephanodiscus triporus TaxID=2934178 RepID=A0ABD3NB91_9STRA
MSPKNPPPGPGWESKLVKYRGQNRLHWLSPGRRIEFEFRRYKPACRFEVLRKENDNDEVRAWDVYRRNVRGLTCAVSPDQYDQDDSLPKETPSPRQAWGIERVTRPNSTISIERTAHAKVRQKSTLIGARSFEQAQKMTRVTKAIGQRGITKIGANRTGTQENHLTGASARKSPKSPPPGPGWESKLVKYRGQNRLHWLSPGRRIEFKRYKPACQFEKLREDNDNDEVRAWHKYRRNVRGATFVVSPHQYDQHDSLPRETPPPRQAWGAERVTGPNGTITIGKTAHAKVRQKSTLIEARSSKEDGQRGIKKIGGKSVKSTESTSTGASSTKSSRSPLTRPVHTTERVTKPSKATVRRKPMVIDQEWALSLVGLRLKVPEKWWNGYTGNTLYAGQIAAVNFSDNAKPFMFELDNEENDESYRMRYDAVLCYADKGHPTHSSFNLPAEPPADPNVTRSGKRKGREELSQDVLRAQKLQKTSYLAAKKLPNASINSKSCCQAW